MTDPLSIAASVSALLTLSIQSCLFLSKFVSSISAAPTQIKYHLLSLKALTATFSELRNISYDASTEASSVFTSDFLHRLELYQAELKDMQILLQAMELKMQRNMLARSWRCVKFALKDKDQLKEFWSMLSMQQSLFTLDLIAAQTRLSLGHSSQLNIIRLRTQQLVNAVVPFDAQPNDNCVATSGLDLAHQSCSCHTIHMSLGTVVIYRRKKRFSRAARYSSAPFPNGGICGVRLQLDSRYGILGRRFSLWIFRGGAHSLSQLNLHQSLSWAPIRPCNAPIFNHVRDGNMRIVRAMFQSRKASPSDTMPDGVSLLHLACRKSNLELVELLLNLGADVHAPDDDGRTPLHWALAYSHTYEVCRVLLRQGAEIGRCDIERKTPLHTYFNTAIATLLNDHREIIEDCPPDQDGMTPLHFVAWSSHSSPAHIAPFLDEQPGLSNLPTNGGKLLIHFASERGNASLLEYLLEGRPDENVMLPDSTGRMPIHFAARTKRVAAMQVLLANGADIHAQTSEGWTVLHEAAARDNVEALKNLIEHLGVKAEETLQIQNNQGLTPLSLARKRRAQKAFLFLQHLSPERACDTQNKWSHLPSSGKSCSKLLRISDILSAIIRSRELLLGLIIILFVSHIV